MDFGVGRHYGSAEIGGHATVQQGDTHTTTALNISSGNIIHISVQGNIEWPSAARKRLRDTEDPKQGRSTAKRKRLHNGKHRDGQESASELDSESSPEKRVSQHRSHSRSSVTQDEALKEQGVYLVNRILEASGSTEQTSLLSHKHAEVSQVQALHQLRSSLRESHRTKRSTLLHLIDRVRQNTFFPAITKVFPKPSAATQNQALQEAAMLPSTVDLVVPALAHDSAQDLVCVFLALLAMLTCSGAGQGSSNSALARSSSKVSLIAGLITFAVARYFCIPSMMRQLSEWAGGSLIVLDPFMHELRVPKAHVEHFTLLEAFLRLKLSGTTAEAFVENGQFNLTLGQRYGRALSRADWSIKGRVKSNQRVVMSVYLKKQDANCVECQEQLIMSESGHFACPPCGKVYGNCAALEYLADPARSNVKAPTQHKSRRLEASNPVPSIVQVEDDEELNDDYDLHGLQNIDIRVLRRTRQERQESRAEVTDHSTPQYDVYQCHAQLIDITETTADFRVLTGVREGIPERVPISDNMPPPFQFMVDNVVWRKTHIQIDYEAILSWPASWSVHAYGLDSDHEYTCSFRLFDRNVEFASMVVETLPPRGSPSSFVYGFGPTTPAYSNITGSPMITENQNGYPYAAPWHAGIHGRYSLAQPWNLSMFSPGSGQATYNQSGSAPSYDPLEPAEDSISLAGNVPSEDFALFARPEHGIFTNASVGEDTLFSDVKFPTNYTVDEFDLPEIDMQGFLDIPDMSSVYFPR